MSGNLSQHFCLGDREVNGGITLFMLQSELQVMSLIDCSLLVDMSQSIGVRVSQLHLLDSGTPAAPTQ